MMESNEELKTSDYLRNIVLNLPDSPGIYQYLNSEGTIIYVGKAKNLKRRVYSYFSKEHQSAKTRILVTKIADIKYIVVNSIFRVFSRQEKSSEKREHTSARTVMYRQ